MSKHKRRKGLSRQSTVKVGEDRLNTTTFAARKKLREDEEERRKEIVSGLSRKMRKDIAHMRNDASPPPQEEWGHDDPMDFLQVDDVGNTEPIVAADASPDNVITHSIGEWMRVASESRFFAGTRRVKDTRTWKQRRYRQDMAWMDCQEAATRALMCFDVRGSPPPYPDYNQTTDLQVVDIRSYRRCVSIPDEHGFASFIEAIIQHGYIPSTPVNPEIAVSISTLDILYYLRAHQLTISFQTFAKMVCDLYKINYRARYRNALSMSFEVYLMLRRNIQNSVSKICGRDGEDWRVMNACPPCCYELEGEPDLKFRRQVAMDGNNSVKRIATSGTVDQRRFKAGDYFIPPEEVDKFANEVPGSAAQRDEKEFGLEEIYIEDGGDVADSIDAPDGIVSGCAGHWKAAEAEHKKRMWRIFDETGMFSCACRHGLILWITDMIRSGELAKYPLAILSKMTKTLGDKIRIGFDIGCTFSGTANRSSLGPTLRQLQYRICTNVFHGYAHSYDCQLEHHPYGISGSGLEDFETMERIFSSSNALARGTRYASKYVRHLYMDVYFQHWDEEKYGNLAKSIYLNFRQAVEILDKEVIQLEQNLSGLSISKADLDSYIADEANCLRDLKGHTDYDYKAVLYVQLLKKLQEAEDRYDMSKACAFRLATADTFAGASQTEQYGREMKSTQRTETERRAAAERVESVRREVIEAEVALGIVKRWEPWMPEYQAAVRSLTEQQFREDLDDLERLLLQRLLEMQKLNMSQTGYKLRVQIARGLKNRSTAIRRAVTKYNESALALSPPRRTVDWDEITHFEFLQEFSLLRITDSVLQRKPWAAAAIRFAMRQHQRILRAREEVVRCTIEARRLFTAIGDENRDLDRRRRMIQSQGEPEEVIHALSEFIDRRGRLNKLNLQKLGDLFSHPKFCGTVEPGIRKGCSEDNGRSGETLHTPLLTTPTKGGEEDEEEDGDHDDGDDSENEDRQTRLDAVINYISNISLL